MSSYDQNLLDEAPKATRAQRQEGYNVDLLEQPPQRTPSLRAPLPLTPEADKFESAPSKSKPSFWRTRNGIIILTVIALLIVGAVVGGAVGGTVKKNTASNTQTGTTSVSSDSSASSTSPPSSGSQGIGGGAPAAASSTQPSVTSQPAGQNTS